MHHYFTEANKKYGRFARIGPQTLLVSDVDYIRKVNARGSSYSRSDWYKGGRFVPNEDTLLSMTDDNEHKSLRNKMAPGFNTHTENNRVEGSIDSQITILLDLIKSKYISTPESGTKPMDWGYLASYFGIDSICDIAFGEPLGDLQVDQDKYNFLHYMEAALPTMSVFACYNWMLKLLQSSIVARYCAPSPDDLSPFGHVMGFARHQASKRFGEKAVRRTDMIDSFIQHGMSPGEAERGGLLQLVAGSDTTATALRAAVLFVATSPVVLARIRTEMAAAGILPHRDTKTIIGNAKARSIPYLLAVVKESLRLHPPVIGALEKKAGNEGDALPDGRRIPPGTRIQVSTWAILRDQEVFGLDADCFRPERWLEMEVESEHRLKMERSTELVFSAGRFICMGRDIALTQLLKVISELFYRFDVTVINPEKPWHSVGYGVFCQHDQWVRVTERNIGNEKASY
ncbi:MAG: hypothetical protein ASARMPRED_007312 [Alectoria sarmentosa]|nr:MAG: hypothetical protein ASARMPRED_007312 [Alectoria sarmentosa]